jgi:hypothetical protein
MVDITMIYFCFFFCWPQTDYRPADDDTIRTALGLLRNFESLERQINEWIKGVGMIRNVLVKSD